MTNLKKCIKKICAVSLAVLMFGGSAVTVLPEVSHSVVVASAASEGTTTDGFEWYEDEDGSIIITGYTGEDGSIVIPSKIDGKTVTKIGGGAFEDCTRLTSVSISDSITSIGIQAFEDCTGLTSVSIPDSVTSIGGFAFRGCTGLTSVSIPDSVTSIGGFAFYDCIGLKSVIIPDSVTEIGDRAFFGCTELTSIEVSSGNENYISDKGVLLNKTQTTLICCPGGFIGSYTIPDSVTSIVWEAFYGCTGLTSVSIPNSVTGIEFAVFSGCTVLKNVSIPDSVTSIGDYAFYGCTGLTSVSIPNSVTSIGDYAFHGCTGLTSVSISDSVASIGHNAFSGCTGLKSIEVGSGNENYSSDNGVLLDKDQKELILCPKGFAGSYTIPDTVTSIGNDAFYGCTELTSVTIPDSVTSISYDAFDDCTGLTGINVSADNEYYSSDNGVLLDKVQKELICCPEGFKGSYEIPDSVTSIGWEAFYDCTGLTSVTIPDSVTEIGDSAFCDCTGLTSVTIPDSVTEIGGSAFSGCTGLTSIYVSVDNEYYSSDKGVLLNKTQTKLICCPGGFIGSYTIPDSVTSICDYAFEDCTGLTDVTIPDSVTSIGYDAFGGCIGLTDVTIEKGVTYIGDSAFSGCTGLTSVTIPDSVTEIGGDAFNGCTGLTSITIPDGVTEIGWRAFLGCTGLTSVEIPDSVTSIGDDAFGYYWDENTKEYLLTDLVIFSKVGSAAEEYANENGIPFVAMNKELSDTETNITVTGDIDENTKLEVSELKPEDVKISGKKACAYYDISLTKNGVKVQPDGNVAVKIPYKGDSENIEVYRINDDGTTEKMQSSYDGEYVTFITDHFSKYAIVTDGGIEGDTNNDGEVNIADALMISRYDAGIVELEGSQLAISDVNGDGEVNIADALMISRFDAGLIDKL